MSDEKNVAQETENTEVEETTENQETETLEQNEDNQPETQSENKEVEEKSDEVDYKAELEKAKTIISHKEKIIKQEKEKNKSLAQPEQGEVEEEDKLTEFRKNQEEELNKFKYSILEDKIEEEISNLSRNDDEAELIRFHIKNTVKFGYTVKEIKEAVKTAWLKANEKRILSNNREMAEALKRQNTVNTTKSSSGQPVSKSKQDYSRSDKDFLRKYGVEV